MRRVLLAVLVTAATTMMMASPAHAGGPTSVLLASPGTARAAALYYTDPRYAELEALLHGPEAERSETTSDYPGTAGATALNVTWLVHDVNIWRTDQLVLGAAGGPWVATWMPLEDGSLSPGDPTWRALNNGDQIKSLVSSLGLLGRARGNAGTGAVLPPPVVGVDDSGVADPAESAPAEPRGESRWFTLTGWRWAIPGLLLGVVGGLAMRRNSRASSGPRQEFIDVERERSTAPG